MKATLLVWGCENGKEFRHDIPLPDMTDEEFLNQQNGGNVLLMYPMTKMKDATDNFVRVSIYNTPQTQEEEKYFQTISVKQ